MDCISTISIISKSSQILRCMYQMGLYVPLQAFHGLYGPLTILQCLDHYISVRVYTRDQSHFTLQMMVHIPIQGCHMLASYGWISYNIYIYKKCKHITEYYSIGSYNHAIQYLIRRYMMDIRAMMTTITSSISRINTPIKGAKTFTICVSVFLPSSALNKSHTLHKGLSRVYSPKPCYECRHVGGVNF